MGSNQFWPSSSKVNDTMPRDPEIFRKIAEQLLKMTAPQYRTASISEDTEVYSDLRIYGDEIVSLVWWLEKEFGMRTNINPFKYAPRELPFAFVLRPIGKILRLEPQYRSLKVRDILAAIEAKRWPDEFAN
jgi:hypothetical protein